MDGVGLEAALVSLADQRRDLDALLAVDPSNDVLVALRASIDVEVAAFSEQALEIRKRRLISLLGGDNDDDNRAIEDGDPGDGKKQRSISGSVDALDDDDARAIQDGNDVDAGVGEKAQRSTPGAVDELDADDARAIEVQDVFDAGDAAAPDGLQAQSIPGTVDNFRVVGDDFCSWVKHTRGIGLKLLMKSGYRYGTGLGKRQQGRVDPITIVKRKPGAGLDFGPKPTKVALQLPAKVVAEPAPDVFDFMNSALNRHREAPSAAAAGQPTVLSEKDCQANLLAMNGRIAEQRSERGKTRSALDRCIQQGNSAMVNHYRDKLQTQDRSLSRLEALHDNVDSARKRHRSSSMKSFKF